MHASLEVICGHSKTAIKVFENLLSDVDNLDLPEKLKLCASYAYFQWLADANEEVVKISCLAGCGEKKAIYSGMDILRSKQSFDELLDTRLKGNQSAVKALTQLRFLLELTTGNVESLLTTYDLRIKKARILNRELEEITLVVMLRLLWRHVILLRNPFPRSSIRDRVQDAIGRFPSNTVLLGIFLECERGEAVWGRVGAVLGDGVTISSRYDRSATEVAWQKKSTSRMIWEVWVASQWLGTHKLSNDGHRLRKLFSKWVQVIRCCKGCFI